MLSKGDWENFFNPAGVEALLPGAGLLCCLVNQALPTAGLHFKFQTKIIPFSHLEENFQVSL